MASSMNDIASMEEMESIAAFVESRYKIFNIIGFVSYSVMSMLFMIMIVYVRYNRQVALSNDDDLARDAARKVILPAFEPLLWLLCFVSTSFLVYFGCCWAMGGSINNFGLVQREVLNAGREFLLVFVMVFMFQKSVTVPAVKRATFISFFLSSYNVPIAIVLSAIYGDQGENYTSLLVLAISHTLTVGLFIYVIFRPPGRACIKTLRQYCAFGIIYHTLDFLYLKAFMSWSYDVAFGFVYAFLIWSFLGPIFTWRTLKSDTEHWRGLGERAVALQSHFRQKANLNEHTSAQGLHVLIEMHRHFVIDFAHLDVKQRIGVGSSAVVYNGLLHSKTPVACKVYTPTSVTDEVVAAFSHEAALCGALNHPNVVQFMGLCISPPTVCLVSELCIGSLDEIAGVTIQRRERSRLREESFRQQQLIGLGYMIDAARAVAYLHSFAPAFVHRDIKPGNFLIDGQGNVKLTDFGESRSLPRANIAWVHEGGSHRYRTGTVPASQTQLATKSTEQSRTIAQSGRTSGYVSADHSAHDLEQGYERRTSDVSAYTAPGIVDGNYHEKMTVRGTVDYMAPEIINGKGGLATYGEAADVYSLAITMWDILNPGCEKYPQANGNHLKVFETVLAGERPKLGESVHPQLRELIQSAWQTEPQHRPSVQAIVHALEDVQEDLATDFSMELLDAMRHDMIEIKNGGVATMCFSGENAINQMREEEAIDTIGEGIRLGNMLMDSGLMHHVKHTKACEYSDALYFFDDEMIRLEPPAAMLEGPGQVKGGSDKDDAPILASVDRSHYLSPWNRQRKRPSSGYVARQEMDSVERTYLTRSDGGKTKNDQVCLCQKLGQRLENGKTIRRRFRRKYQNFPEDNLLTVNLLRDETLTTHGDIVAGDSTREIPSPDLLP